MDQITTMLDSGDNNKLIMQLIWVGHAIFLGFNKTLPNGEQICFF
jgi:hypothetical protein